MNLIQVPMKKSSRLFPAFVLIALLALMLFHADLVTEGARNGLLLWYSAVVPALFPFMVLSGLIVSSGGIRMLTAPFHFFLGPLFGLSSSGIYVLITGLLCGYPMGAKTCGDFLRQGQISLREGRFLMAVCNHPSPMFILGFAWPLLEKESSLPAFLFSIYGPLLLLFPLSAFFCSRFPADRKPGFSAGICPADPGHEHRLSGDEIILNAAETLCRIGGCLMLFSIGVLFIQECTFLPGLLRFLLTGSMEMTTGVRTLSEVLPSPLSGASVCAALSFGGFSGIAQTQAVLGGEKNAGLSIRHYFLWKLLHGILSFLFFLFTVRPFPGIPLLFP